jgi:transposase
MPKRDARSLSSDAQEELRRRAIHLVEELKKTRVEAARILEVTRKAVGDWVKAHRESGEAALASKRRGRPVGGTKLSAGQAKEIADLVRDRNPDQLKLPFYLWTREAVAKLIELRFGLKVSVRTAGRYLAQWGFTPQKPARRAHEQNPEAVKRWLEEEYPAIHAEAQKENATIFWGDESGLRSDHTAGRSFAPRGKTPVVRTTGNRFGCNMISALSNRGKLYFMVFRENFTTKVFLQFLDRMLKQHPGKIYLIVDGHGVHRSKAVANWVEERKERIRLFRLPSYSPELNPDELVNQDVKANAVGRRRARTVDELMSNVRRFLRGRQNSLRQVRRYFRGRYVAYAA